MIKKIIILFLMVTLFSCTTPVDNVAPKPEEKDNHWVIKHLLRNIITQGMDF
jgi:hypothetical protein